MCVNPLFVRGTETEESSKYIPEENKYRPEVYGDTDETPEEDPRGEGKSLGRAPPGGRAYWLDMICGDRERGGWTVWGGHVPDFYPFVREICHAANCKTKITHLVPIA